MTGIGGLDFLIIVSLQYMTASSPIDSAWKSAWKQFECIPRVFATERKIPGSWQYTVSRHQRDIYLTVNEQAILHYHYDEDQSRRFLELRFCMMGQSYCQQAHVNCDQCRLEKNARCFEQVDSVDLLTFRFEPIHLKNLIRAEEMDSETDAILHFRYNKSFTRPMPISVNVRNTLDSILNHSYSDALENIFINAQTQILLLYCLESINAIR